MSLVSSGVYSIKIDQTGNISFSGGPQTCELQHSSEESGASDGRYLYKNNNCHTRLSAIAYLVT